MKNLVVKLSLVMNDRLEAPTKRLAAAFTASMLKMTMATQKLGDKLGTVGSKMKSFGNQLSSWKVSAGIGAIGTLSIKTAASLEDLMSSLETAAGSQAAAKAVFADIDKFSRTTPYGLSETLNSWIKLKNLGLDPSMDSLRSFGNTASSMNKSLDQMIEAVADAATGEFERLKEFGIKSRVEGKKVTFTFQGIKTTVKNDAASIQEYLKSIGDVNFGGAMEKKMNNWNGLWSNFIDTLSSGMNVAGLQIMETLKLKEKLTSLSDTISRLITWFVALPAPLRDTAVWFGIILAVIGPVLVIVGQFVIGIGGLLQGLALVWPMLALVSLWIGKFSVALFTTPVGWFVLAIAAIAGAVYLIIKNWSKIAGFFENLWDRIKENISSVVTSIMEILRPFIDAITLVVKGVGAIGSLGGRAVRSLFSGGPSAPTKLGPPAPVTAGSHSSMDAGGTLNIKIDNSGQASVLRAQPNDPRMDFAVDTGLLVGGSY